MNTYIGIDLGTSAVKLLLVGEDGKVLACESRTYPVMYPHSGWSEQDPDEWIAAVESGISALLSAFDPKDVKGISCGGQMHGLVILDEDDKVIRPCILWNDGRTAEQTQFINSTVKNISDLRQENSTVFFGDGAFTLFRGQFWIHILEFLRRDKLYVP